MHTPIETVNKLSAAIAAMLNDTGFAPYHGAVKVGVDLGTADIQTLVLDRHNRPLACYLRWAEVVRDGIVVDYQGAREIVSEQLQCAAQRLDVNIERVATAFPPGTDPRISVNVVEAAGVEVSTVIDEPSSVAQLLSLQHAAVVDIGGGTTGTAIVEQGRVVASADDPTGGHHITLALAGHYGLPYDKAEWLKRMDDSGDVLAVVRPVIAKMADLVRRHIAAHAPPVIYLTGGCCALHGFAEVFAAELADTEVVVPERPLHLTPLAIAACADAPDVRLQAV
ncbi:ethanolamine utilization protein EutJ [Exilibacterium tricleocarpae]|uniref:Ethanolamine utilization protein EutJ n=1 Tax=Exilibacterium tricleocarpae TaxID=2591008 RepID=A0A545TV79_9GAMM|nr:ethanolamine utilization protein EutJ [Exilibacterium tricleocarpae]TQV81123.1 ethanolamine utilization protein EutJ [Exilibacterium tricleocarpae]